MRGLDFIKRIVRIGTTCLVIWCFSPLLTAQAQVLHSASVKDHLGRPSIWIDEKPHAPLIYALTDVPGGRWTWEELSQYNIRRFYQAGFRLFQVDLSFDHVWKADGSINLDTARMQVRGLLAHCPDAMVFIRFHVNPPKWWQEKYTDELTVYGDVPAQPDLGWGLQRLIEEDEETPTRTSIASERWLKESGVKMTAFLREFSEQPEAAAVVGIQVAGGVYGEWHYWGFINNEPDYGKPMLQWYRKWLTDKYKNDKALQLAWQDPVVTLRTAALPSLDRRKQTTAGIFRDPQKEQAVIDYYQAQHRSVTRAILHFCKIVKEQWPKPIITGAFYGYFYAVFGREVAGGHLDLQSLLRSPDIDFLSGPGTYYPSAKEPGDPYRSRSLTLSVRLHGKLWLDEMDQQPPLVPLKDTGFARSLQSSIATTRRNVFAPITNGQGLWFYDFGPSGFNGGPRLLDHGSMGWWDEPTLMKDIQQLRELITLKHQQPFRNEADVLLVHSTETFYHTGSDRKQSTMGHFINNWVPVAIYRSGVVHDVVSIDDMPLVDLKRYKAIVFVNTWMIPDDLRKWIKSNLASNGRHLIWIYAPAYSNGKILSKAFVEELTGFALEPSLQVSATRIVPLPEMGDTKPFSVFDLAVDPFFLPTAVGQRSLGTLESNGKTAIASKKFKDHSAWYLPIAPDQPDFWRSIFRNAGAHIYTDSGEIIYSGSGMLTIHSGIGGYRKIMLRNGKSVQVELPSAATLVLDPDTGEILLNMPNLLIKK